MKKIALLATFAFACMIANAQSNLLYNQSFEGQSQPHVVPSPWETCFDGTPDTQPGTWGVNLPASDGNTYVSFLMTPDGSYQEGVSQQLTSCLYAGVTYTITLDLAFSAQYQTAEPGSCYGSLGIWGGYATCDKNELLCMTPAITDTTWQTYTLTFTPTQDWCALSFGPAIIDTCSGYLNCLMDNIRDFQPLNPIELTTLSGKVFYDVDNNCIFDTLVDYAQAYKLVNLQPANRFCITDANGNYTLSILATTSGNHQLDCNFSSPTFDVSCPVDTNGYNIALSGVSENLTGYNFSLSSSFGPCTYVGINSYAGAYRPSLPATRFISITNYSTIPLTNAALTVEYADTLARPTDNLNLPYPNTLNNNLLNVSLPTMYYGQTIQFYYEEEINDFAVLGTESTINFSITPENTCVVDWPGAWNDHYTDVKTIVNSYDPNDKQALPVGQGTDHNILKTDDIEYTIRFQNLGTDTAFVVQVIDTLSNYFDISTLNIGQASRPFSLELVNNNVLVYTFNNILLPPASTDEEGSIGMFNYKIAQKQTNQVPYLIQNRAHIYFDLNPAIITNTVFHNVKDNTTAISESSKGNIVATLYPNPASNSFVMKLNALKAGQSYTMQLFTGTGALVHEVGNIKTVENTVDVSTLASGLYYYRVLTTDGKTAAGRFVKE